MKSLQLEFQKKISGDSEHSRVNSLDAGKYPIVLTERKKHIEQFLNTETGEFAALADDMWVDRDKELEEEIENSDCYLRLPNQYEIHYRTKE